MTNKAKGALDAVLELSLEERLEVAGGLLESLGPPHHVARDEVFWIDELNRRMQAIDDGEPTFDADEVMEELKSEFGIA